MSMSNVRNFYERLVKDETFRTDLQDSQDPVAVGQMMKESGYVFTQAEFEAFTGELLEQESDHEILRDLKEEELEAIFGGLASKRHRPWPIPFPCPYPIPVPLYGAVFPELM
jgi:predicted ribosomally synthesized peptide with nif11-like leader